MNLEDHLKREVRYMEQYLPSWISVMLIEDVKPNKTLKEYHSIIRDICCEYKHIMKDYQCDI